MSAKYLLTSTYPKNPELISPAGKPIAIIFSVIYVISKSNPPSYIQCENVTRIELAYHPKTVNKIHLPILYPIPSFSPLWHHLKYEITSQELIKLAI